MEFSYSESLSLSVIGFEVFYVFCYLFVFCKINVDFFNDKGKIQFLLIYKCGYRDIIEGEGYVKVGVEIEFRVVKGYQEWEVMDSFYGGFRRNQWSCGILFFDFGFLDVRQLIFGVYVFQFGVLSRSFGEINILYVCV